MFLSPVLYIYVFNNVSAWEYFCLQPQVLVALSHKLFPFGWKNPLRQFKQLRNVLSLLCPSWWRSGAQAKLSQETFKVQPWVRVKAWLCWEVVVSTASRPLRPSSPFPLPRTLTPVTFRPDLLSHLIAKVCLSLTDAHLEVIAVQMFYLLRFHYLCYFISKHGKDK